MNYEQRRHSRADDAGVTEGEYDEPWPGRLPSSSRRYFLPTTTQAPTAITVHPDQRVQRHSIPPRRSALPPAGRMTEEQAVPPRKSNGGLFRSHPLLWIGFGMLVMLLMWVGLQDLGSWWNLHQDDATYGRPRTAQYDVVVGHNDSSSHPTHVIVMNLNATIVIIELPGGDTSKAKIYQGPHLFDPGADLYPVTLSFADSQGKGQPNMEVHVQGQLIVYLNQHGQFVPQGSSH